MAYEDVLEASQALRKLHDLREPWAWRHLSPMAVTVVLRPPVYSFGHVLREALSI